MFGILPQISITMKKPEDCSLPNYWIANVKQKESFVVSFARNETYRQSAITYMPKVVEPILYQGQRVKQEL